MRAGQIDHSVANEGKPASVTVHLVFVLMFRAAERNRACSVPAVIVHLVFACCLELLRGVEPALFLERFGVGLDQAQALIQAKTLTIAKLMAILPPGTVDPR